MSYVVGGEEPYVVCGKRQVGKGGRSYMVGGRWGISAEMRALSTPTYHMPHTGGS